MLRTWRWQFINYARAEGLRRLHGPHDVVVRARVDVLLLAPLLFDSQFVGRLEASTVYALGWHVLRVNGTGPEAVLQQQCLAHDPLFVDSWTRGKCDHVQDVVNERCRSPPTCPGALGLGGLTKESTMWSWSDWMYVGLEAAMAPLGEIVSEVLTDEQTDRRELYNHRTASATGDSKAPSRVSVAAAAPVLLRKAVRCFGVCPEEQVVLQLNARGIKLAPLGVRAVIARLRCNPCNDARAMLCESTGKPKTLPSKPG